MCLKIVHMMCMTLLEYIRTSDYTFASFAEKIGETENIVRKWAYRQRQPSLPNAIKVEDATGGKVPPRNMLIVSVSAE